MVKSHVQETTVHGTLNLWDMHIAPSPKTARRLNKMGTAMA